MKWQTAKNLVLQGHLSGDNPSERIKLWEEHFKNFLGRPASLPPHPKDIDTIISETSPIPVHQSTIEELTLAIRSTSSGKATGLDNIPAEVWGAFRASTKSLQRSLQFRRGTKYLAQSCYFANTKERRS